MIEQENQDECMFCLEKSLVENLHNYIVKKTAIDLKVSIISTYATTTKGRSSLLCHNYDLKFNKESEKQIS